MNNKEYSDLYADVRDPNTFHIQTCEDEDCTGACLTLPRKRSTYLVATYDVAMAYGGPEEGGWWYNAGSLVRVVKAFPTEERANQYCRRLNNRLHSSDFGPNAGRREMSSVLSDGRVQAEVYENVAPLGYPDSRPRYE